MIKFDRTKCEECYDCVRVCPVDVWGFIEGKLTPNNEEECTKCGTCAYVCEMDAIKVED